MPSREDGFLALDSSTADFSQCGRCCNRRWFPARPCPGDITRHAVAPRLVTPPGIDSRAALREKAGVANSTATRPSSAGASTEMSRRCGLLRRARTAVEQEGDPDARSAIDTGDAESTRATPEPLVRRAAQVRRDHRCTVAVPRTSFSGYHRAGAVSVRHRARRPRLESQPLLVADSAARAERPAGGAHDPVPAGNGQAQAGGRVQGGRTLPPMGPPGSSLPRSPPSASGSSFARRRL